MAVVVGISSGFHDSAAALVIDGVVIAAAEEERFSRLKHDSGLPVEAVAHCLSAAGLTIDDVDHLVYYEKPLRKFGRLTVTTLRTFPRGLGQFVRAMGSWLGERLWLEGRLSKTFDIDPEKIGFSQHHLSHAASAFYTSPFDEAAVVTVDGVGEWATTGIFQGAGNTLTPLAELQFPHSMGLLYSALTAYLGFRVNEGEYKVMGLAPYGTPRFREAFAEFVQVADDATLTLDMRYFCFDRDPSRSFTKRLETLLGPARAPESELALDAATVDSESQRFADIAATLQAVCEDYLLSLCDEAHRRTGSTRLCLAGGVALNCVANGRIARESPFEEVHVHPAAGDAGGAIGAALYASHGILDLPRAKTPLAPGLGQGFAPAEVTEFLTDCRIRFRRFDTDAELHDAVAARLADGEVGAWFQGRFEWGPRALGQRSILADPRQAETRERVNRKIKFREPFRPFAPAVLADEASQWFALDPAEHLLSPSMLTVTALTEAGRETLPAVCHVDGTARVQTVTAERSPDFHALLSAFKAQTGLGCLLNTSLNLRGEPIATTPGEAYSVFARSDLDFVVLEGCLVAA
ncbi:MAG: carbamoyltransferase [Myxococcota bacterium]|jgi:carbamoyltransferase